jgi:hypothetical protein
LLPASASDNGSAMTLNGFGSLGRLVDHLLGRD